MRNLIASIVALGLALWMAAAAPAAHAQSTPGLYNGQVPTAGQWNSFFAAKQDYVSGYFTQPYTWSGPQTWSANATFQAHVSMTGVAPNVTSCGTSPSISGSDEAGEVTTGTGSPTSCTITFHTAYATQPTCLVQDRTLIANLTSFTVSTSAIVVTNTAASSQKLAYHCLGL